MKIVFAVREVMPEGGLTLASFRLATALLEAGHEAEVLYCAGEPPPQHAGVGRGIEGGPEGEPRALARELERRGADVAVVGSDRIEDLAAASSVAPTLMHAHLHVGTCPDFARYWSRLQRPCGVNAGWRCAALRPLLGCTDLRQSLRPQPLLRQQRLLELLEQRRIGVLCVSTRQAEIYRDHGLDESLVDVLPNLGIRASAAQLAQASAALPEQWRSATAFIGRLSKAKGGQLLPDLAERLAPEARLRVFGDGYLAERLSRSLPPEVLCGHVTQETVAGVLMWARALLFPSLWPEPGGIVGVDAQVMGVPVAAFDTGAAAHWPAAARFAPRDVDAVAAWLSGLEPCPTARDAEAVASAQAGYWRRIGERGAVVCARFRETGGFERSAEPAEALIA